MSNGSAGARPASNSLPRRERRRKSELLPAGCGHRRGGACRWRACRCAPARALARQLLAEARLSLWDQARCAVVARSYAIVPGTWAELHRFWIETGRRPS
jgi:hypothetical protein